jgi:hypothetical protein
MRPLRVLLRHGPALPRAVQLPPTDARKSDPKEHDKDQTCPSHYPFHNVFSKRDCHPLAARSNEAGDAIIITTSGKFHPSDRIYYGRAFSAGTALRRQNSAAIHLSAPHFPIR